MMAEEESTQKCSDKSSKKSKQKKVPQRGLGVAQLEKIRLEEQQKKVHQTSSIILTSTSSIISPNNSSSCLLAVQCPTFRPNPCSSSSIPLPPLSPNNLPSPSSFLHPNSIPISKSLNVGGGGELGWPGITGPGQRNWPKLWRNGGECNLQGENGSRLDNHHHQGFAFPPNMNLPYESTAPIWPLPSLMQRSQQFQRPPPPSSSVNDSSVISSTAALNFQTEPPSNQSYYCSNNNNYYFTPPWPEEDKIVGMKRPYPFSPDNPPGPSFLSKFPPSCIGFISRSDEPSSCSNGGILQIEPGDSVSRDGDLGSGSMCEPSNSKTLSSRNGGLAGDFLTLAPPAAASPPSSSKNKHLSGGFQGPQSPESCEFEALPSQARSRYSNGNNESLPNHRTEAATRQQPFFSFLPSAKAQIGIDQSAAIPVRSNSTTIGGMEDRVDLNLKL